MSTSLKQFPTQSIVFFVIFLILIFFSVLNVGTFSLKSNVKDKFLSISANQYNVSFSNVLNKDFKKAFFTVNPYDSFFYTPPNTEIRVMPDKIQQNIYTKGFYKLLSNLTNKNTFYKSKNANLSVTSEAKNKLKITTTYLKSNKNVYSSFVKQGVRVSENAIIFDESGRFYTTDPSNVDKINTIKTITKKQDTTYANQFYFENPRYIFLYYPEMDKVILLENLTRENVVIDPKYNLLNFIYIAKNIDDKNVQVNTSFSVYESLLKAQDII